MYIPYPLHAAIIHFPIVLLLLGTLSIILSFPFRHKGVLLCSLIFFSLGAISVFTAMKAGHIAQYAFLKKHPDLMPNIHIHAAWAYKTFKVACVTSILSILSFYMLHKDRKKIGKTFQVLTLALSVSLSYFLFQTADAGGVMLYHKALELDPPKDEPFAEIIEIIKTPVPIPLAWEMEDSDHAH